MTGEQEDAGAREEIERQAAEWIVRLSDPALTAESRAVLRAEHQHWLGSSPCRREVHAEIDRTWRLLRQAAIEQGSLGRAEPEPPRRLAPRAGHRLAWRLAAAVVIALSLGLARFYGGDPLLRIEADYQTAPGETRSLTLADGSSVVLGSNSAIELDFDGGERRLRLLAGEAAFEVAADPARPFVVEADDVEARALGTRFQLRRDGGTAEVTVIEHLVRVSRDGTASEAPVILGAGEQLAFPSDGAPARLETVDLDRATAWQRGHLVFDRQPLGQVVAELNRHRRGRIVLADDRLAAREVSGVFRLDDLDNAVDRIARELGARHLDLPPFVSLLY